MNRKKTFGVIILITLILLSGCTKNERTNALNELLEGKRYNKKEICSYGTFNTERIYEVEFFEFDRRWKFLVWSSATEAEFINSTRSKGDVCPGYLIT